MLYISNTFSADLFTNVLPRKGMVDAFIKRYNADEAWRRVSLLDRDEIVSLVNDADLASVLTTLLGRTIEVNKDRTSLKMGDELIWVQYNGPKLLEGATMLPKGSEIVFLGIRL